MELVFARAEVQLQGSLVFGYWAREQLLNGFVGDMGVERALYVGVG